MVRSLSLLLAASIFSFAPAAFAGDEGLAEHAGDAKECGKMFKGADRKACRTCVKSAGHHFYRAAGADRCRVDDQAENKNVIDKAGDKIGGAVDSAAGAAGKAGAATGNAVEKAGDKIGGGADKAADESGKASEKATEKPVDK